jgi:hypothetical protein
MYGTELILNKSLLVKEKTESIQPPAMTVCATEVIPDDSRPTPALCYLQQVISHIF